MVVLVYVKWGLLCYAPLFPQLRNTFVTAYENDSAASVNLEILDLQEATRKTSKNILSDVIPYI